MNWIESIGEAIAYIETHLTDELSPDGIAERVFISPAYFQKVFALLCGFTVAEYIRNRRLAEAGNDLLTTDVRVIDLALKYGYDSPDSFTKAFTRFHGASPTAVRKNGRTIKAFEPLKIQFLLKGGYIMDYRLEKIDAFRVTAKVEVTEDEERITYRNNDSLSEIQTFCWSSYLYEMLCQKEMDGKTRYTVYMADSEEGTDGFETYDIPEMTWAVFRCEGTSRDDARERTWKKLCDEWLPQTRYEIRKTPWGHVNVNYTTNEDFGEIWVPIQAKE